MLLSKDGLQTKEPAIPWKLHKSSKWFISQKCVALGDPKIFIELHCDYNIIYKTP